MSTTAREDRRTGPRPTAPETGAALTPPPKLRRRPALVVAAVIDGYKLKVPNWITFPMVLSGWAYGAFAHGWEGIGLSLIGTIVGLALLMPAYAIGGMGAGDVKLLAGVGS